MKVIRIALYLLAVLFAGPVRAEPVEILNVSYDPTREFYEEYNTLFTKHWKRETGKDVVITQSHGGSGKQARSVIEGLQADVVTLALAYDIDVIAEKGQLLNPGWQKSFPHDSAPYTSTIVFLVRKGNPKKITDWNDLLRSDVQVVTPNPKTSGGARWNYMAAWAFAKRTYGDNDQHAIKFIRGLFKNVPVLDAGARGSTTTFIQRNIGDVLIAWENEAFLAQEEIGKGKFEIVIPSVSIKAEPPVAMVDKNVARKGTKEVAHGYLEYLYSPEAQEIVAKHYYRPTDATVAAKYTSRFPALNMVSINDFGGWKAVQKKHFDDGGVFDQIYAK